LALFYEVLVDFDKSIVKYPSIRRAPGGASNDLVPNLKDRPTRCPMRIPTSTPKSVVAGA